MQICQEPDKKKNMDKSTQKHRKINNSSILWSFYHEVHRYLKDAGVKRHLDIGHGKDLKFPRMMAARFHDIEIGYYDNSDIIMRLLNRIMSSNEAVYENLKYISSLEGEFDSASYFFTIHHFPSPLETLREIYGHLKNEGIAIIIDYDLNWLRQEQNAKSVIKDILNSANEKKVMKTEQDWFEAHTKYSLEQCVKDAKEAGFHERVREVQERKLFLYIGEK